MVSCRLLQQRPAQDVACHSRPCACLPSVKIRGYGWRRRCVLCTSVEPVFTFDLHLVTVIQAGEERPGQCPARVGVGAPAVTCYSYSAPGSTTVITGPCTY